MKTPINAQNNESFLLVKIQFNYNTPHCAIHIHAKPLSKYPRNVWGLINYLLTLRGVLHTKPKPKRIAIPTLRYSIKHHVLIHFGLRYQKGIARDHKDGVKLITPFKVSQKCFGVNHIYFDN